ncbi:DUF305 domain-containing protein [Nocardioides daphniae]|uniref:DUF305 domain-containing protein n=2 Tax=Nocardioides daphniae TaxID=402297 RepID=A0A4P7U939_9ACTN|nr:DUF305 domain-containing protein [Nocardioides daphniae]QCC76144.1 DUF305 domain-containing protein [Nocardioides daphniae]GGD09678.1 hypothetical protein GCM10007231_05660 [Nocardioides daphniae]
MRSFVRTSAAALTLALTLSACGGDDDSGTRSATEHNDADVSFAQGMIPHHAQALSMVDMLQSRPLDPELETLAEQIRDAQGPEIELMADWLEEWDEEVPETMRDHVNSGHDMGQGSDIMEEMGPGHDDMPGMMSADDFEELEEARDDAFQEMWLRMMIEHHEGAIEMAETEQEEGRFEPAIDLAGEIVESQTAEIETMQEMLAD